MRTWGTGEWGAWGRRISGCLLMGACGSALCPFSFDVESDKEKRSLCEVGAESDNNTFVGPRKKETRERQNLNDCNKRPP
jgi:hypothetical protein